LGLQQEQIAGDMSQEVIIVAKRKKKILLPESYIFLYVVAYSAIISFFARSQQGCSLHTWVGKKLPISQAFRASFRVTNVPYDLVSKQRKVRELPPNTCI
jgi:hypothetical protein